MPDLEPIYVEKIAPVVENLLSLAREHGMPFAFVLQIVGGSDMDKIATAYYTPPGCAMAIYEVAQMITVPPEAIIVTSTNQKEA